VVEQEEESVEFAAQVGKTHNAHRLLRLELSDGDNKAPRPSSSVVCIST
jgi:hypothetical protein